VLLDGVEHTEQVKNATFVADHIVADDKDSSV